MENLKVKEWIENTIKRIIDPKNKMDAYSYLDYFSKRNNLTIEENLFARTEVSRFMDEKFNELFEVSFTINGVAV